MCENLSVLFCLKKTPLVGLLVTFDKMVVQYYLSFGDQNDALLSSLWPTTTISCLLSLRYLQSIGSGNLVS